MKQADLETIIRTLRGGGDFLLTTHVNPDGDGLGSELALRAGLVRSGKKVRIVNHSPTPGHYRWLDPDGLVEHYSPEVHDGLIASAGMIVVLDTNQPDRLRSLAAPVRASKAVRVIIDHHLDPDPFADICYIDDGATSTGELVFRILTSLLDGPLGPGIAVPLYTAVMTDTGSFRYPRTGAGTHRMVAQLIEEGADPPSVFASVYETWSPGRMRLLGEALDTLTVSDGGSIAHMVTTRKMFSGTGTTEIETDTFSAYPMNIRNVRIGILFTELADGVKISFRSKGSIPVNRLAREFGGNGHLNAAGARLHDVSLDAVVSDVLNAAKKYIDNQAT